MRASRLLALAFLLFASRLFAQSTAGEISGVVTDPSGSVVPGVNVSLINPSTNTTRSVKTNEAGLYVIPAIQPAVYDMKVELSGFRAIERKEITVQVGSANRIDFTLEVGEITSVVEVSGGAPVLQTETTSVGTVIENRRIVELPLNGRNYLQLASLIPGSTTNGPASAQGQQRMGGARNTFALNVSGQRIHFNHYALDGMENTDLNFNSYMLLPSIDALQEFKVESGLFAAEYGRAIAQINVSTKSGTNQLHGSVFEFLRNSALDAKNYFDRPADKIPPFKRNQYGFTVGGPIMLPKLNGKDKLFFLANYEGLRERKGLTQSPNVPLAAERVGDFSGNSAIIYDPLTRVFDAAGNVVVAPTPFPGNRIPDNRINSVSRKLLEFFPLPQTPGRVANFINTEARRVNAAQFTGRVDWNQNPAASWFFRYSWSGELRYDPRAIPDMGINTDTDVYQALVSNTRVFGATKVNEAKFSVSYLSNGHVSPRANTENVIKDLGIGIPSDNPLYWGVPNIETVGLTGLGEESDAPFLNYDTTIQALDNFSWTKGKHAFKFGGEFRRIRYNQLGGVVTRGRFGFDQRYTQGFNTATRSLIAGTGAPMADFLLGYMNNSEGQIGAPIANFRSNYFALFLQDTWKVTPKLSVNWGLRWENDQPFKDKHDAIVNIDFRWDNSIEPTFVRLGEGDPFEGNPPYPLSPSIKYVRDGRFGDRVNKNDLNDFAPRLGIAYQITPKTVLRTGFGVYYVRDIGNAVFDSVRNAPFTVRNSEPAESFRPNLSYTVPFTRTGAPTFILINQYGEPTSYVNQWSFGLQRELTQDMSIEANYFGSSGVKLRRLTTYNNTRPSSNSNSNLTRPFPQFGGMQNMNAPSHSSYHALQVRLQQRFAHGFTLLSSYAYGKSIDNGSGVRTTDGDSLTPSDDYNLELERGLSAFDFRQRLTTSWLYELPFGKGQRFMNTGGIANVILGGWQVGGILTLQDGFPITALCGGGLIQNGGASCYPNATGISPNLKRSEKKRERFFNTDAFVDLAPGRPQFVFGNAARNTIIGPGIISFDASANKKFSFGESRYLEFRTEFFNMPNHPIFNPPGRTLRVADYGVITATKIDSRQIQFGLKLVF